MKRFLRLDFIILLGLAGIVCMCTTSVKPGTKVSIRNHYWYINDTIINQGSPAEGLLLNVRMVNSVFEDIGDSISKYMPGFDPEKNTESFIRKIPEYVESGVNAFTISLQGGIPGYEGAVNSAFNSDGSVREEYLQRVEKVIKACDKAHAAVILSCFYQRQHSNRLSLNGKESIKNALKNVVNWITRKKFTNVILEVSNEYRHGGYKNWPDGEWLMSEAGQAELIRLAKSLNPDLLVSTSGMGNGMSDEILAHEADYITIHFNTTSLEDYQNRIEDLKRYNKTILCNEDDKLMQEGAIALSLSVLNGCGWGYMNVKINQEAPFEFLGTGDDTIVYRMFRNMTTPGVKAQYYPPPDSLGGWRQLKDKAEIRNKTGINTAKLDEVFEYIQGDTKNGGLLVLKDGWLVYEKYFGKGDHEATANLASCGKSFTSVSIGILMAQHPELFPDGLDQKIFTPKYLPEEAFPLEDPLMSEIKLGQLLSFTAGIRGNNPGYVYGKPVTLDTVGPDGWYAMVDKYALGKEEGIMYGRSFFSARKLWCKPGGGYSYSTASMHIASIMLRKISGMELQDFIDKYIANELGWGRWGFAYQNQPLITHTPGGGGIVLRPTDMLRFGYLLLHEGKWNDKQIIPAGYVHRCSRETSYNPHYPYSFQFNVNTGGFYSGLPRDAFWKIGSGDHCLYIVPSLNLVIWKLGGRDDEYDPKDTGIPVDPEALKNQDNRDGWKKVERDENSITRTLELVIESIERK